MKQVRVGLIFAVAVFAVFSNAGAAVLPMPQFNAEVVAGASFDAGCDSRLLGPASSATCRAGFGLGAGGSEGSASASGGKASAASKADVFTPNNNLGTFGASVVSIASFSDHVYFTGPANSQINVTGRFAVEGTLTADALGWPLFHSNALTSYQVSAGVNAQGFTQQGELIADADGTRVLHGQASGTPWIVPVALNFDAQGESQVISVFMSVRADARAVARGGIADSNTQVFIPGEARGESAFGNTAYWDGILSATDVLGNPFDLSQLQAFSASGFDYMTSAVGPTIPEPNVASLLFAGFGLLAWRARRFARTDELTHC